MLPKSSGTPRRPNLRCLYESPYDHFWTDSRGALGAAYKAFQYGMYGYGYGANGTWNDVYSKPGEPGDYGTAYQMPEHYFWWYDGANLPTGDQLTYFKAFYKSLEWWKLTPRFDDDAWGSFKDTSRSLLSSDGQDTYVVFFFGSGTSTGTLNHMEQRLYLCGPMVQSARREVSEHWHVQARKQPMGNSRKADRRGLGFAGKKDRRQPPISHHATPQ